ncbi:MAG TPA: MBL fold metallo-hydrolase [Vicinamibacteria bacterium]|nr:MBL fold metallo-hydrolase [Vicinamibacteria bacterium]
MIAPLDALDLLVVVDNETDTLSSIGEGIPQVPQIAYLAGRAPVAREIDGHPCKVVMDRLCCAGHGFSVLATARRGDETHSVLVDVGPYPDLWLANAERLSVDLAAIEAIFLSHWHYDHSGGLPTVVAAIAAARSRAGRPPVVVDLHPDRPDQRGTLQPGGTLILHPEEPRFDAIEAAGGRVVTHADDHALGEGFYLASGRIERTTPYETGLVGHHSFRGGRGAPDPLILDERFLAAHVRGRGITVVSSCSHAGVVNACLGARARLDDLPIDVILGGFHLSGRGMEARIEATVRDLKDRIDPRVVAPAHCTGWRAKAALVQTFAPGQYGPSTVGSMYVLRSGDANPRPS